MSSSPVVAVFNTSEDTTDLLRFVLEHAGFTVVTAFTNRLRDAEVDFSAFMHEHQPAVIVYDVSIPYEQNWRLFEHFRDSPACRDVGFVITTTNVQQLRKVAGPGPELHEIIGKPYDLDAVVRSVRACLRQSGQEREDSAEGLMH
jgi:DNA-binding response OmpR family regulator